MPDRSEERSLLEYAFADGDTGEIYKPWDRVYKTSQLYAELCERRRKPVGLGMRSVVVMVRLNADDPNPTRIDPAALVDENSLYYHDVQFPRRSGLRGNFVPSPS